MDWFKTGDVVKAFKVIWPFITGEMIRAEADRGLLNAMQFGQRGGYFYEPGSILNYLTTRHDIDPEKRQEALRKLGLNFRQMRLELISA